MAKGDKYIELMKYLSRSEENRVTLTFEEIEEILKFKLPTSARNTEYSWWGNDVTHSQATAWLNAGYKTIDSDIENQTIIFIK